MFWCVFRLQAVSSRPDLLPPVYLAELEKLQDQIPPFPNADAYAVIQLETGQAPSALFSELSADTVAAASLGQVRDCPAFATCCEPTTRGSASAYDRSPVCLCRGSRSQGIQRADCME